MSQPSIEDVKQEIIITLEKLAELKEKLKQQPADKNFDKLAQQLDQFTAYIKDFAKKGMDTYKSNLKAEDEKKINSLLEKIKNL